MDLSSGVKDTPCKTKVNLKEIGKKENPQKDSKKERQKTEKTSQHALMLGNERK